MLSVTLAYTRVLSTRAVPSTYNRAEAARHGAFSIHQLSRWRRVILDPGARRSRAYARVHTCASHCSLQLRVTSRVQTMSFRFARLRILPIPLLPSLNARDSPCSSPPFCLRASRCTRIRAPTRFFLGSRRVPRRSAHSVGRFAISPRASSIFYTFLLRFIFLFRFKIFPFLFLSLIKFALYFVSPLVAQYLSRALW